MKLMRLLSYYKNTLVIFPNGAGEAVTQPILVHILIRNNEKTILRLLDSLSRLGCDIVCVDLGCTDDTVDKCLRKGVEVRQAHGQKDMSTVRNGVVSAAKQDWHLYLEPWEVLVDVAHLSATMSQIGGAYSLRVMTGEMVTHEVRFWNRKSGYKFKNPVYEYLNVPDVKVKALNCSVYSDGSKNVDLDRILEWKNSSPGSIEPAYYEALYHLGKNEWKDFINRAKHYLFDRKLSSQSAIMMKYYLAIALCHIERAPNESIKHILECIAAKPLMAEFWCLLGDAHYHILRDYKQAKQFYQNAITLGSYRLADDTWPMELGKYGKYPRNMVTYCDKLEEAGSLVVQSSSSG